MLSVDKDVFFDRSKDKNDGKSFSAYKEKKTEKI